MHLPALVAAVCDRRKHATAADRRRALTLVELLVTIAIIGILAAISIQGYRGIQAAARETTARENLELLNRGLLHFSQTNWDIVLDAVPGSATDELAVLRSLQWRSPIGPTPGSPYIPINFSDTVSSSSNDYRIQWNGHTFQLLTPGIAGTGLRTGESSPGAASTYSFPGGYQPLGPPAPHE
jgi:prepilin-type N-terminal cleavage/methylation domain-containing protein